MSKLHTSIPIAQDSIELYDITSKVGSVEELANAVSKHQFSAGVLQLDTKLILKDITLATGWYTFIQITLFDFKMVILMGVWGGNKIYEVRFLNTTVETCIELR